MEVAPDASPVEARIELTQADVLHGLQGMTERRLAAVIAYLMAATVLTGAGLVQGFGPPILMAMAFSAVLLVSMSRFGPRRAARQYFSEIPADRREITYAFTPAGFEITTKHSLVSQQYQALKHYLITPHTLLLYGSSNIAQIVPLRAFDAADRERLLAWVKAHVQPAPRRSIRLRRTLILWGVLLAAFALIWWFLNP